MGKLQGMAVALAVVVGTVGIGAVSAQAVTVDDVASWITDAALDRLGVEVTDPALADALNGAVQDAVDSGLITVTVGDIAQSATEDPDSVSEDEVDDALGGELDEQSGTWQDIALAWHEAFDQIKAEFAACRSAAVGAATGDDATSDDAVEDDAATEDDATTHGASECAHEFRYAMQLNHLEAWQARHDAKLTRIAELPAGQREKVLANFDAQRERAEQRVEKAAALLERQTADKTKGPKSDDQRGNKNHEKSDRGQRGNSQRGNSGK